MKIQNLISCLCLSTALAAAAPTTPAPKFDEVFKVLTTHLGGVSPEELDRAAVQGLLAQLGPRASLEDSPATAAADNTGAPLAGTRVFDNAFAYVRIANVTPALPESFRAAYQYVVETNKDKIKGLVLDLRFATGTDYDAAAKVADCFLNSDRPLLDWQTGNARATKKASPIAVPVAILVNSKTTAAAEALAAVLREANVGLILGATTAGQASLYKDFPLSNGEELRVAVAPVSLTGGKVLAKGIVPDVAVTASLDDERAYLQDPYQALLPAGAAKSETATNLVEAPARRFDEAELVRQHKAGEDMEDQIEVGAPAPVVPVMADPVLAHALDLLKGLAIVQLTPPG
jgi:C-terminal processing protease CtpA/Prc